MTAFNDGSRPDQAQPNSTSNQPIVSNPGIPGAISVTAPVPAAAISSTSVAIANPSSAPGADASSATPAKPTVMQSKQIGRYLVEVINDKCISAASCVAIAPAVFQLDEQNIAYVVSQDGHDDDTKLLAAQSCPTAAIIVTDTVTGKQVWPLED
jgi:ferredoxin